MKRSLMKKLFSVTLTGVMAFGLIACGNNAEEAPAEESAEEPGSEAEEPASEEAEGGEVCTEHGGQIL